MAFQKSNNKAEFEFPKALFLYLPIFGGAAGIKKWFRDLTFL